MITRDAWGIPHVTGGSALEVAREQGVTAYIVFGDATLRAIATLKPTTLEDLAGMVRLGEDFVVFDAKSGDDITRSVLTQIIVEEESKGQNQRVLKW